MLPKPKSEHGLANGDAFLALGARGLLFVVFRSFVVRKSVCCQRHRGILRLLQLQIAMVTSEAE